MAGNSSGIMRNGMLHGSYYDLFSFESNVSKSEHDFVRCVKLYIVKNKNVTLGCASVLFSWWRDSLKFVNFW